MKKKLLIFTIIFSFLISFLSIKSYATSENGYEEFFVADSYDAKTIFDSWTQFPYGQNWGWYYDGSRKVVVCPTDSGPDTGYVSKTEYSDFHMTATIYPTQLNQVSGIVLRMHKDPDTGLYSMYWLWCSGDRYKRGDLNRVIALFKTTGYNIDAATRMGSGKGFFYDWTIDPNIGNMSDMLNHWKYGGQNWYQNTATQGGTYMATPQHRWYKWWSPHTGGFGNEAKPGTVAVNKGDSMKTTTIAVWDQATGYIDSGSGAIPGDSMVYHFDIDVYNNHFNIKNNGTTIFDVDDIYGDPIYQGNVGFFTQSEPNVAFGDISIDFSYMGPKTYKITLANQQATSAGSTHFFEKYNTGCYSNVTCTDEINKISIPFRTNYIFDGYYTKVNGGGAQIIDNTGNIVASPDQFEKDTTIYANWKINPSYKINVTCIDTYENTSNNTKEYITQSAKTYKYGDTAKGSDWGKNSTKTNYSYINDTQITLKSQSIPESAYNISPDAVAKMEKVVTFDQNGVSADEITNTWDMIPNPNGYTVYQDYIANVCNSGNNTLPYGPKPGYFQSFLYQGSYNAEYKDIQADIITHACQGAVGLIASYDKNTDTAYIVGVMQSTSGVDINPTYHGKIILAKETNFSRKLSNTWYSTQSIGYPYGASGNAQSYSSYNPYVTILTTANCSDAGIPSATSYHNLADKSKAFHLQVKCENGYIKVYGPNNKEIINYYVGDTLTPGGCGLYTECNGAFLNVSVASKSESMAVTNGLVINPNGGAYDSSNKTAVYVTGKAGSKITLKTPTRNGYTFAGWSTNDNFNGNLYISNNQCFYEYANFANIDVIVATWIPNTVTRYFKSNYKVNFDGNQATSGSINTMTCNYGANYNIPENNFERTGYIFKEFNTEKDGTGTSYKVGQSFKNISNGKSEITLYAIWTPIKYYVLYDRNGAQDGTLPFDTATYDTDYIARENIFEWEHFEFQSWNTMPDGSGQTILENEAVKNLCNTDNDSITLYAQWKITDNVKKYTLTVKPNKGEFEGSKLDKQFYYIPDPSAVTTFGYSRSVQTYTVPSTGYYFLEAYGAKGGNDACPGGFGGYVKSFVKLEKGTVLYIQTGEAGYTVHGADACRYGDLTPTYGGGGLAGRTGDNGNWSGVGGGATSISTALYDNGELESYVNHRDDILVVAGGGGGGSASNRGIGGQVLYAGSGTNYYIVNGTSASLLRGDHHPNGQDAGGHDGGGGGGGFIGGVCGWDSGAGRTSGGGASFVNSSRGCYSYALTPDACAGHGYVKISKFDTSGIKVLEDPTRLGYTFDTWKNYGDGKLEHEKASNLYIVDFSKNDTTVEAQWIPNTYYVIYKNYDGKGNDFTQTCTYDTPSNYLANTPDLSDSIFIGWFENDNPKDLSDGKIPGGSEFINLTPEPFGKIYVYGKWSKTNENKDTDATKPIFIKTTQIQIDGSNIYKEPTEDKKYFIKNDTEFDLNFNGMIDSDIDVNFLPVITNETSFEVKEKEISITNNDFKFNENLNVSMSNNQNTLNASTEAAAVRKNNSTPGTNKTLLNYKQVFTLSKNKDGELVEINPHSSFNLTRQNETGNYTTIYKTDKTDDKNHNIYVECDATRPTIINDSKIDEKYVETSNNYNPLISEKETITFNYADFIGNVNASNPKYGSGIKTSNIKLTVTQEQTDKGGNSKTQIYTGDSINSYIKVTALTAHTGKIEIFIDPENYSDMSGFIDFKLEITDNVGNTATKEIRILVLGLQTQIKNTSNGINKGKRTFAQGENGQIIIETNGFADKVDIKFPSSLDSLSSNEKVSGSTDIWETGRTLSDTYPRDASGAEMTVPSKYQTKLWGTTHKGGVQANKDNLESCYLTHYFYAPLYAENNKYETYVTIYKTDPKYPDKTYSVTKKVNVYIGIDEDDNEIAPITDEFRDELKDN